MKTRPSRRQTAKVSHSRWLAYATASAATALAGSHSAEAAIHYSGRLDVPFPPHENTTHTFQLDQTGVSLFFERFESSRNRADCSLIGGGIGGGIAVKYEYYVLKRPLQYDISHIPAFWVSNFHDPLLLASARFHFPSDTSWGDHGTGFVGFRFDTGAGLQYGWVRVKMTGQPENGFRVLGYAYADPGEPIRAGQRSSDEQEPEEGSTDEQAPDEGSLGGLALGAVGLLAWRKSRSRIAR